MAYLIKISTKHPVFLWIFSGNILYYLINIEDNGNDIFFMIRNIILVLGALWVIYNNSANRNIYEAKE